MPRQPRLDVEGALHHVIVRGIERSPIFKDNKDRQRFVDRLADLVGATGTKVYAWALIPNHFHLLLRSGASGLPTFMRRLLTGYAITFNKRHNRSGHLFQNRYKSIICEEDPYFLELVRYIHLNPLRSRVVRTIDELDAYPWSGHRSLLGRASVPWQDGDSVLIRFGQKEKAARTAYRRFMEKGVSQGHRPELTGGGLVRSLGGMQQVLERRNKKDRVATDERILGAGDFVKKLIEKAKENRTYLSRSERIEKMEQFINERCRERGIRVEALTGGSKAGMIPKLRSDLAVLLVNELGISYAEIARRLGISTPRVSKIIAETKSKLT
jgi:REP element-mobilizing transposase RayT